MSIILWNRLLGMSVIKVFFFLRKQQTDYLTMLTIYNSVSTISLDGRLETGEIYGTEFLTVCTNRNGRVTPKCSSQYLNLFSGKFMFQSSVRKKMAAVHLTTIPCEPNTAHMAHRNLFFCEIIHRTNNIVHAGFQRFRAFLCVFMSVFIVFAR